MTSTEASSPADPMSRAERAFDSLLEAVHLASPDELPTLVADHAAQLGVQDAVIYLADLQQPSDLARVVGRLERALAAHNEAAAAAGRPYRIAWSVGAVLRESGEELTAMLARADAALYREKRARGQGRAA